jgi:NADH-quinone oxidoreductase subunit M
MSEWTGHALAVMVMLPLVGAAVTGLLRRPVPAARCSIGFVLGSLVAAAIASTCYAMAGPALPLFGLFAVDGVSAPLLPAAGFVHLIAILGTAKALLTVSSCVRLQLAAATTGAALTCQSGSFLIGLMLFAVLLPAWDLMARGQSLRGYLLYMVPFAGLVAVAWSGGVLEAGKQGGGWPAGMLGLALILRGGIFPLHAWQPALFRQAGFGTAVLFLLPLVEVVAAIRLLLPVATASQLELASIACLFTAVYCGGLAIVQANVRRFYALVCLSQTSLVLFAVLQLTAASLTAALCLWLSAMLSLAGLGFSIRALEARYGQLSLNRHHGCYEQVPEIAICFFVTGLASVGFPGTIGFLPMELLVSGSLEKGFGFCVVLALAAMLNGVAIMRVYFALFTGIRRPVSVSLRATVAERVAMILILLTMIAGGWFSPGVIEGRHRVAEEILKGRTAGISSVPQSVNGESRP